MESMARMPNGLMPNSAPGLHQEVEDGVLHLDRMVQLPAELADEVDAQRMRGRPAPTEIVLPDSQGKACVGEVGVGELLENLARARAGQHEHAEGLRSPA